MTTRDRALLVPFFERQRVKDALSLLAGVHPALGFRDMIFNADCVFVVYGPQEAQDEAEAWILAHVEGAKPW